jgi:hypothetical protein
MKGSYLPTITIDNIKKKISFLIEEKGAVIESVESGEKGKLPLKKNVPSKV